MPHLGLAGMEVQFLSQPLLAELGLQFSLCCYVVWPAHNNYCQKVFCVAKLPILDPLARDNILLTGLFLVVPIDVSVLLTSLALTLKYVRQKENSEDLPLCSASCFKVSTQSVVFSSYFRVFLYLFYASFLGFSEGA